MRINILILIFFLFLVIILFGCATPIYVPNTIHAPLFSKSKDLNISGFLGTNGTDLNVDYSINEHLWILAGGSFRQASNKNNDHHKHNFGEIGLGYYHVAKRFPMQFSASAGFGLGTATGSIDANELKNGSLVDSHYNRTFFTVALYQNGRRLSNDPVIAAKVLMYRDIGVAFRCSYVDFYDIKNNRINLKRHINSQSYEFIVFYKVGFNFFDIEAQVGFQYVDDSPQFPDFLMSAGANIYLGSILW